MNNKKTDQYEIGNEEIDLGKLILDLWEHKKTIIAFIMCLLIFVFTYHIFKKKEYTFILEVHPINEVVEDSGYDQFNTFMSALTFAKKNIEGEKPKQITPAYLLNFFTNNIENLEILKTSIIKSNLEDLDVNNFDDIYNFLKVSPPDIKKNEKRNKLEFSYSDKEKGLTFSKVLEKEINENIRTFLLKKFTILLNSKKQINLYEIEDLNFLINLEEEQYKKTIEHRLAYLKEQSEIARTLGIKTNTVATQNFESKNTSVLNIKTDTPFYFAGYEAIEKEIELINSRLNPKLFIGKLIDLERQKILLSENKNIDRVQKEFVTTPVYTAKNFKAGEFMLKSIETTSLIKFYLLAIVLGGILGSIFVLIRGQLKKN
jgi:LPS O-antigen subunit length determinant protein (WzzB/FepE family)